MFHVYILYSESKNRYYKGQTKDLSRRFKEHNAGQEKSTRSGVPWKIAWSKVVDSYEEALLLSA